MDKAPDAYRTISEVADELDLPQHVLRFWETRFAQIKPLKRGGGRRYYRPDDIDLLRGIRHLLYGEGYTIRGVQRIIKESGIKAIQALGRGEGSVPRPKPGGPDVIDPETDEDDDLDLATADDRLEAPSFSPPAAEPRPIAQPVVNPGPAASPRAERLEPVLQPVVQPPLVQRPPVQAPSRAAMFREAPVDLGMAEAQSWPASQPHAPMPQPAGATIAQSVVAPLAEPPAPEPYRAPPQPATASVAPPIRYAEPLPSAARGSTAMLAADHIRRLQAALYELSECRRRLDQAFEAR